MALGAQVDCKNRRQGIRHKSHAPAYASFGGESRGVMRELHEVLNIGEKGVAIQCTSHLEPNRALELCLDLSGEAGQICTTAFVAWSDGTGRAGLSFPNLPDSSRQRLREWLFFNTMVAAANAESSGRLVFGEPFERPRPNYSDTLTAVSAVQREAEALGSDLSAVLGLIACRARALLGASGAAIALSTQDPDVLRCHASAGECAPPVGVTLHVGSGFSGECVRSGCILRCDDAETDPRVDRESCSALGICSMLAAPIVLGQRRNGIIEVFSAHSGAFSDHDSAVLQRLAGIVQTAVTRTAHSIGVSEGQCVAAPKPASSTEPGFSSSQPVPGSVLFPPDPKTSGSAKQEIAEDPQSEETHSSEIHLPRSLLVLLSCALAAIFLAMGFVFAPSIQQTLRSRARRSEQTVFASSPAPNPATPLPPPVSVDTATLDQLQHMAEQGNAAAENALGLRYATGDGVKHDEKEAARWFMSAAEHGNVAAQSKLGQLYWSGRGVAPSLNQAYFWTLLARAGGQEGSKTLAPFMASRMTSAQRAAIEQQAADWYSQHEPGAKPSAGR